MYPWSKSPGVMLAILDVTAEKVKDGMVPRTAEAVVIVDMAIANSRQT